MSFLRTACARITATKHVVRGGKTLIGLPAPFTVVDVPAGEEKIRLRVTQVGEFVNHKACQRRFKLDLERDSDALKAETPFVDRLFETLDPVLQAAGRRREDEWEQMLSSNGFAPLTQGAKTSWQDFTVTASRLAFGQEGYGREVSLSGELGGFDLSGQIDFVVLRWDRASNRLKLRLVECKASRRDRTYQRIQVAIYRILLRRLLTAWPLTVDGVTLQPEDIECLVVRIDAETNESFDILSMDSLDEEELQVIEQDVQRLLAADGLLARIAASDLNDLEYQLDAKCGNCVFNVHCFPESARQRRLELLGLDASTTRNLRRAGVATIDDLAELDPVSEEAQQLRVQTGFSGDFEALVRKARVRKATLPGVDQKKAKEVQSLLSRQQSALPAHGEDERRLVRIFISVDQDYTENRLAALTAHVTRSDGELYTGFSKTAKGWVPDPDVRERRFTGERDGEKTYSFKPLRESAVSRDVVHLIREPWLGDMETDSARERDMILAFFSDIIAAASDVAKQDEVPIHFYVWSQQELKLLIESCARIDSQLLSALQNLLGCREGLEQLIYTSLQDEVYRRYALAWSGRSLVAAASLNWFGNRYHWKRKNGGQELDLDQLFRQDIFNFTERLGLTEDGRWAKSARERESIHRFEVRGRYSDALTAPYLHAAWGTLKQIDNHRNEDGDETEQVKVSRAIKAYQDAARPKGYLETYLKARVHALRWIEERFERKNEQLVKPPLRLSELATFTLEIASSAQAAIDFLRLDQHVKVSDWLAVCLSAPAQRVSQGAMVPLKEVVAGEKANTLLASIDAAGFGLSLSELAGLATFGEGSFVRIAPRQQDPQRGQTLNQLLQAGKTCRIEKLDWESGEVVLTAMRMQGTHYKLYAGGISAEAGETVFDFASLDESPSDFVADRVEKRLAEHADHPVVAWLDLVDPQLPTADVLENELQGKLEQLIALPLGDHPLAPDQARAVLEGLTTRIQLLQGPPGTGKTQTTSVAVLTRILAKAGPGEIILVGAHTHTAVDTLLARIDENIDVYAEQAATLGLSLPPVRLGKVSSSGVREEPGRIESVSAEGSVRQIKGLKEGGVLVLGGTTGALLKLAGKLDDTSLGGEDGFTVRTLIIDEASMMVFPHFLALATLLDEDGEIMLAGDHRQLSPIVAHDWDEEDRPPSVMYMPFASAYEAIQELAANAALDETQVRRSALHYTFRLPPAVRKLISGVYSKDEITLGGREQEQSEVDFAAALDTLAAPWLAEHGVFLLLHAEAESQRSNEVEAKLIQRVLEAAPAGRLQPSSVAVVTPHRAQRTLLKERLNGFYGNEVDLIDTVERLQGGERETVFVSACASDPSAIAARAEFLLDLNRANVAFSRAKQRLVVVCSESLLEHIPTEIDLYESSVLWKTLRALCQVEVGEVEVDGHRVRVFAA